MKMRPGITILAMAALYAGTLTLMAATPVDETANPPVPAPASAVAAQPIADETAAPDRVVVYYFHTTQRCPTCRRIESWSELALTAAFKDELADSSLVFLPVNVDEKGNEHFVKDYELYTKSLIVSDLRSGVQLRWENLQKVWEYTGNQAQFFAYVQSEVRKHLAAAQGSDRG